MHRPRLVLGARDLGQRPPRLRAGGRRARPRRPRPREPARGSILRSRGRGLPSTGRAACACRACRWGRGASRWCSRSTSGILNLPMRSAQNARSSSVSAAPGSMPAAGSTTALISSPQSSCGMPNTATSPTFGMGEEHALDLGGIDVHAAADDHVGLAVAEEQVAVVVEVADVADGEEPGLAVRLGLVLVLEVLELGRRAASCRRCRARRWARRCRRRRGCGSRRWATALPTVPGFFSHSSGVTSVPPPSVAA